MPKEKHIPYREIAPQPTPLEKFATFLAGERGESIKELAAWNLTHRIILKYEQAEKKTESKSKQFYR